MNKTILSFVFCVFFVVSAYTQKTEVGVFAGGAFYMGDLNPAIPFLQIRPAGGVMFRHNLNKHYSLRANLKYAYVAGSDAASGFNTERNEEFSSQIIDLSPQIEVNFFPFLAGEKDFPFTSSVFAGVSIFSYDSGLSFAIPFGVGVKANMSENMVIGFEWSFRKTYTDNLDGLSDSYPSTEINIEEGLAGNQLGNSSTKDWYSFAGIVITFRINGKPMPCPAYKNKNYKDMDIL